MKLPNRLPESWPTYFYWLILVIAIVFAAYARFRLLGFPLERDEGEFAYAGQLLLKGIPPYQSLYSMKLPGTYFGYAALMSIFGQTVSGIHAGLLLVNIITIVLVFLVTRDMFGVLCGSVAALTYSLLSTSPSVLGMAAHATHFVALFAMEGIWLLWRALRSGNLTTAFLSGTFFGVAFLMKQQSLFLSFFGALALMLPGLYLSPVRRQRLLGAAGLYIAGSLLPFLLVCLWLWHASVLDKFWFWTVDYARKYCEQIPLSAAPLIFAKNTLRVITPSWPLWALAIIGAFAFIGRDKGKQGWFLLLLLVASFLCVCPGFYFRPHYFIVLLPVVSILSGVALLALQSVLSRSLASIHRAPLWVAGSATTALLAACALYPIWQQRDFYFTWTPEEACRQVYGPNPFVEAPRIADYLAKNSSPRDQIAVLGSEPELSFYSKRRSATGHIYTYGLMEAHPFALQMQKEMAQEIEAAKPKFLLFVSVNASWLARPKSETFILDWARSYSNGFYDLVGIVDIVSETRTEYKWDGEALTYRPQSSEYVLVFKRKA